MKLHFLPIFIFASICALAQTQAIESKVNVWGNLVVNKKEVSEQRKILEGSSAAFKHIEIHATTLYPHQKPHPAHKHNDEEMIIIKEGELTVTIEGKTQTLEAGSVAVMMPGDEHGFENKGNTNATYYVMRYESISPADVERGKKSGGSFWVKWNDMVFQAHDKGGIRRVFDKPTTMAKRFEMHITTLNEGLLSHPPHTHKPAEILLIINNNAEESINGTWTKAQDGDLIFLESNVPHAIRNIGKGSCTYFAFQFE